MGEPRRARSAPGRAAHARVSEEGQRPGGTRGLADPRARAMNAKHRLIVIGKGLVGHQLAQLAEQLDFDVQHVSEDDLDAFLPSLQTTPDDFVAIVARNWERDRQALDAL